MHWGAIRNYPKSPVCIFFLFFFCSSAQFCVWFWGQSCAVCPFNCNEGRHCLALAEHFSCSIHTGSLVVSESQQKQVGVVWRLISVSHDGKQRRVCGLEARHEGNSGVTCQGNSNCFTHFCLREAKNLLFMIKLFPTSYWTDVLIVDSQFHLWISMKFLHGKKSGVDTKTDYDHVTRVSLMSKK